MDSSTFGRQFISRAAEAPSGESGQTEPKNPPGTLTDQTARKADEQPTTSSLSVIGPHQRVASVLATVEDVLKHLVQLADHVGPIAGESARRINQ